MIVLTWKSLQFDNNEKATIFVSETNHFKEGGKDVYREVGEIAINAERDTLDIDASKPFYKILLKGPHHYHNVWVIDQK